MRSRETSGQQTSKQQRVSFSLTTAVADCIRTSLGPRGMDKMIKDGRGETLITNDGATILQKMDVVHPTAKMVHFKIFSSSKSPRLRMSKLEMAQPQLSFLQDPYSKRQNNYWTREFTLTSSQKVRKIRCRIPKSLRLFTWNHRKEPINPSRNHQHRNLDWMCEYISQLKSFIFLLWIVFSLGSQSRHESHWSCYCNQRWPQGHQNC